MKYEQYVFQNSISSYTANIAIAKEKGISRTFHMLRKQFPDNDQELLYKVPSSLEWVEVLSRGSLTWQFKFPSTSNLSHVPKFRWHHIKKQSEFPIPRRKRFGVFGLIDSGTTLGCQPSSSSLGKLSTVIRVQQQQNVQSRKGSERAALLQNYR